MHVLQNNHVAAIDVGGIKTCNYLFRIVFLIVLLMYSLTIYAFQSKSLRTYIYFVSCRKARLEVGGRPTLSQDLTSVLC